MTIFLSGILNKREEKSCNLVKFLKDHLESWSILLFLLFAFTKTKNLALLSPCQSRQILFIRKPNSNKIHYYRMFIFVGDFKWNLASSVLFCRWINQDPTRWIKTNLIASFALYSIYSPSLSLGYFKRSLLGQNIVSSLGLPLLFVLICSLNKYNVKAGKSYRDQLFLNFWEVELILKIG